MEKSNNSEYEAKFPRILIISHNSFNMSNNMGKTLCDIFKYWPKDCLGQLYFRNEKPTKQSCNTYYMITDIDMVKCRYKKQIGISFEDKDIDEIIQLNENKELVNNIYNIGKKRKPYMYIARNLLWSTNRWNSKKLEEWIDNFKPDLIYFASGGYAFSCKIALEIAKKRGIPMITQVFDDFYIGETKTISPLYHLNRRQFKYVFNKVMKYSKKCIYVCDAMKKDYDNIFGEKSEVLMTSSEKIEKSNINDSNKIKVSYIGNLGLGRWKSLLDVGKSIKELSYNSINIDVYSVETRDEIIKNMTKENGINFHGSIGPKEVKKVIKYSDVLIHVESMHNINREKVKYSISTKIAESLNSGACIFAYGPSEVASINYLKENNSAWVVSNKSELEENLRKLLEQKEARDLIIQNAYSLAHKRHNESVNKEKFKKIVLDVI